MKKTSLVLVVLYIALLGACNSEKLSTKPAINVEKNPHDISLNSLADLSIDSLRNRQYDSVISAEKILNTPTTKNNYTRKFFSNNNAYYTGIVSYNSDGLSLYSRIDIPDTPTPSDGFPVVIFIHGWVGLEKAPAYDFSYNTKSNYAQVIDQFVKAGFVVLTPGLRGHGTVNGSPAEGIEFIEAWDNGSYISPLFYTIDTLNLIAGLTSLNELSWPQGFSFPSTKVDTSQVNIFGHSQGGDVALTALAISGEGSKLSPSIQAGAIWAGCFLPRFEQLALYGPMGSTTQAFLSGDNTWTGSAMGSNGKINPNFLYPYPADWIGTPDNSDGHWTWQKNSWPSVSVAEALTTKLDQMYHAFNNQVDDIKDQNYHLKTLDSGKVIAVHADNISKAMSKLDAINYPEYLQEKLILHHSDRDYYSPTKWNQYLVKQITKAKGLATNYQYYGNTHSMTISENSWFSPEDSQAGFATMMQRNIALFKTGKM